MSEIPKQTNELLRASTREEQDRADVLAAKMFGPRDRNSAEPEPADTLDGAKIIPLARRAAEASLAEVVEPPEEVKKAS